VRQRSTFKRFCISRGREVAGQSRKTQACGLCSGLTQRDSIDQPNLHDAARRTVHDCLDREVGSIAGGARGVALLKLVRSEIAALRNGVSKPVGRYKDALAELKAITESIAALEQKQNALARDIRKLTQVNQAIAQTEFSGKDARLKADLAAAKEKKEAARRYEEQEKRAQADFDLAQDRLREVEKTAEQRTKLRNQMEVAARKIVPALTEASTATQERESITSALARQSSLVRSAEIARGQASHKLRNERQLESLALKSEQLTQLQVRRADADAAQQTVNDLSARQLSNGITQDQVKAVEDAVVRLERARAVLEAQATRVTLDIEAGAKPRLSINGAADWNEAELLVVEDLVLAVEGIGTITISPGIKDRDAQLNEHSEADRTLRNALAAVQVTTLVEARAKLQERQDVNRDLKAAEKEVKRLTQADAANGALADLQALHDRVSVLEASLRNELTQRGLEVFPTPLQAQEAREREEHKESLLANEIAILKAPVRSLEQARDCAIGEEASRKAALKTVLECSEQLSEEYRQMLDTESDETLACRRTVAADNALVKRGLLEAVQRGRPAESVAGMETRINRLETGQQQWIADLSARRQRKAVLESTVEREVATGIGEQIEDAYRHKELLDAEVARSVQELAVLDLLRKTLEDAEREARERYMAPVVGRIVPYLQRLFPSAAIQCDENFATVAISRAGEEGFRGLSDGTQEQIAVLTRLAFADMLIDSSHPAMLILYDALAYSDSARLETIFDVLAEASTRMQILVLTCREDAFRRLGGTRIRLQ